MGRKILYSPGWGTGWSTANYEIPREFMCQYQPIIEAVERGDVLTLDHPAIMSFLTECKDRFGVGYVNLLGIDDLCVWEVADGQQVRIEEYDGNESVHTGYTDYF